MRSNKFLYILLAVVLSGTFISSEAQVKVTDGAVLTMDANSLLELESTNKGLLIPRMAINDVNLVAPLTGTVPTGMLVYSTGGSVTDGFYYWNGSQWKKFLQANLQVNEGGTGVTAFGGINTVLYTSATDVLSSVATSSAAGQFLQTTTSGSAPTWKTILGVANGGTGSSTQNYVDLTTVQTAAGEKTWSNLGTFNLGLTASGAPVNLNASSNFNTNINTGTSTGAVAIGSISGATSITQRVGTGNFSLDGIGASTYTFAPSTTTGTISIGGTAQTGIITLGSSTAAQTLNLGTGTGTSIVNIANGLSGNAVTIANGANTSAQAINIGAGASAANNTINIGSGTNTGGITAVTIGSNANLANTTLIKGGNGANAITMTPQTTGAIVIGATAGTGTITVGSSTAAQTVNIGTGTGVATVNIATGDGAGAIHIGDNNGAGSSSVQIGGATTINGAINLCLDNSVAGNDTYTATNSQITALVTGLVILFNAKVNSNGACTLNLNGSGAINITNQDGSNPGNGDLRSGGYQFLVYSGTKWILIGRN